MLADVDEDAVLTGIDLDAALERLPQSQRKVLQLRMQGYSQQEVAQMVGKTRAAVATLHRQAVERLKQEMGAA